jgi:hypothetical protein
LARLRARKSNEFGEVLRRNRALFDHIGDARSLRRKL